jgi:hypothetical protein
MKKVLHSLFGIVFILFCFCSLVATSIWAYLTDSKFGNFSTKYVGDFSLKYERFISEFFTFEYFLLGLFVFLLLGLFAFIICGAVVLLFMHLFKWPCKDKGPIYFFDFLNTYTVIGFVMIYAWFLALWVISLYN